MKNFNKVLTGGLILFATTGLQADQVILDDLIVDGSNCVGQDCVNGEAFGFDTIRLKENNLRIKFQDTSTTSSFPSRDWQLTANDSSNGGANKFSIDDVDGGRTPFTIEANAPSHSLYVDDGGRLGLGTSTPAVDVHTKSGNSPTLRLEQDGSSGFTPQTWDVAGNETNFFIRDATNGSTLPLRIRPGAPSNSIYVKEDGQIGFGTQSPQDDLHISDNGPARLRLTNTSKGVTASEDPDWTINSNGDLRFTAGSDAPEMTLSASGDLVVTGGYYVNATQLSVPDYVFEPTYELKSIEDQAKYMFNNKHLPSVLAAPKPDGQLDLVSQQLGMLEELEKAHIYISELHNRIKHLETENNQMVSVLEARLQKLEDRSAIIN